MMGHLLGYIVCTVAMLAAVHIPASAETYYVTPTSSNPCPEGVSCFTLSQYAIKKHNYFASNTTLILLPGNHSLDSEFSIRNVPYFSVTVENVTSSSVFVVTCSQSGKFRFETIEQVSVSDLVFAGCVNNTIISVSRFMLENCTLHGQGHDGIGLEMKWIQSSDIIGSSFCSFVSKVGGAISINSSDVRITDSTIKHCRATVSGGGVYAAYSNITIQNASLINNTVREISIISRGGAVYALYSNIMILNTMFIANSVPENVPTGLSMGTSGGAACVNSSNVTIINATFSENIAVNGGAVTAVNSSSVTINASMFYNNTAKVSGGGYFIHHSSSSIHDCTFSENLASVGSAISASGSHLSTTGFINILSGKVAVFCEISTMEFLGNVTLSNNVRGLIAYSSDITFSGVANISNNFGNSQQASGVLNCFLSNITFIGTTILVNNTGYNGGAIYIADSTVYMYGNTTIAHNNATLSGGGIYAYESELNFRGRTNIHGNNAIENGGGISAVGSIVKLFEGSLQLSENGAKKGGGIHFKLNARFFIIKESIEYILPNGIANCEIWLRLEFINNSAEYGGALYVDDTISGTCASQPDSRRQVVDDHDTNCFFQAILGYHSFSSSDALSPTNINFLNTYFFNNTASIAGGTIYGGLLDRCNLNKFAEIRRFSQKMPSENVLNSIPQVTNIKRKDLQSTAMISSDPVQVYFCRNGQPDENYTTPTLNIRKGETFTVPVVAVDQLGHPVQATIHASTKKVQIDRGQIHQNTSTSCKDLKFRVFSFRKSEKLSLYAHGPCNGIGISKKTIDIQFELCPIGFVESQGECKCDSYLLSRQYISACSIDHQSVLKRDHVWIAVDNTSGQQQYLIYTNCPFDYCLRNTRGVNVTLTNPNGADAQCAFNRSGKLCGSCEDGLSLSLGSSRCRSCSNNLLALLIAFCLAGVALVVFILTFNLTVASGTINGLIFYANIIASNSAVFLPLDKTGILTIFIAWLNLDFGFETCFYDGLDGYTKIWLQFAFPFYILFLVAMVICCAKFSQRFAKLLSNRNPVATLATLILLSYAKLVRTILAALSFAKLQHHDTGNGKVKTTIVWLIDANIGYFKGEHIPLFIFSLILLLVGLVYTFSLLFWQWLQHCPRKGCLKWIHNVKLNAFMDAYHAPYTKQHRYWTGLLLLVRVVLYLVAAVNFVGDPKNTLLSIVCVVGGLFLLKDLFKYKVYKIWSLNALESSFIFNLVIFATATFYNRDIGGNQAALFYTSCSIAFLTFLSIIVYHAFTNFKLLKKLADLVKGLLNKLLNGVKPNRAKLLNKVKDQQENAIALQDGEKCDEFRESILGEPITSDYQLIVTTNEKKSKGLTHTSIEGIPHRSVS